MYVFSRTIGLITICSQILTDVKVPFPFYTKEKGFHTLKSPIFRLFPVSCSLIHLVNICYIIVDDSQSL